VLILILRFTLAFISVLIGFAGLLLPILPGWLFFGIAAILLFPETPLARRFLEKIENRFPSTRRFLRYLMRDDAA